MVIFGVGSWIKDSSKKEAARLKRDTCHHYNRRSGSCIKYSVICCSTCKRWEQKRDRPRRKGKEKSYIKRLRDKLLGEKENMENTIEIITGMDRRQWVIRNCKIGEKIIDIGSNNGWIFKDTDLQKYVTSVDIDSYNIPNFYRMSAEDLQFPDGTFDVAVLGEVLEHVDNPIQALKEAARVARRVLMTIPNEYEWTKENYPFETIEHNMERRNLTLEEIVKVSNPDALEVTKTSGYSHLFHNRWYKEETLRKDLELAGIVDYGMKKLNYGGWSFFVIDTEVGIGNDIGNDVKDTVWKEVPNITYGTDISVAEVLSGKDKGKLRIALISTPFFGVPPSKYGGLEQIVWDLAEGLDELGHTVTLFAPEGSKIPKHGILVTTGPALDTVGVNWYKEEENRYFKWKDVVINDRFDIVCGHDWFGFEYLSRMNNLKLRVLHTHHGGYVWDTAPPFPKPNLVAISKWMKLYTEQYFKQKGFNIQSEYVYNGIDLSRYSFDPLVEKTENLLFVGRLSTFKQPHSAVNIARKTNHKLDIIGSASFVDSQDYVKQLEKSVEGDSNIVLYENASHELKIEKMQKAKVLILPSKFGEPFGLVAIEAMACGCPVICLRDGALPEIVIDGLTGFVCDTEQEMEDAIKNIDQIKPEYCRKHVEENFSRIAMAKNYEKLYYKMMKGEDW